MGILPVLVELFNKMLKREGKEEKREKEKKKEKERKEEEKRKEEKEKNITL